MHLSIQSDLIPKSWRMQKLKSAKLSGEIVWPGLIKYLHFNFSRGFFVKLTNGKISPQRLENGLGERDSKTDKMTCSDEAWISPRVHWHMSEGLRISGADDTHIMLESGRPCFPVPQLRALLITTQISNYSETPRSRKFDSFGERRPHSLSYGSLGCMWWNSRHLWTSEASDEELCALHSHQAYLKKKQYSFVKETSCTHIISQTFKVLFLWVSANSLSPAKKTKEPAFRIGRLQSYQHSSPFVLETVAEKRPKRTTPLMKTLSLFTIQYIRWVEEKK